MPTSSRVAREQCSKRNLSSLLVIHDAAPEVLEESLTESLQGTHLCQPPRIHAAGAIPFRKNRPFAIICEDVRRIDRRPRELVFRPFRHRPVFRTAASGD